MRVNRSSNRRWIVPLVVIASLGLSSWTTAQCETTERQRLATDPRGAAPAGLRALLVHQVLQRGGQLGLHERHADLR